MVLSLIKPSSGSLLATETCTVTRSRSNPSSLIPELGHHEGAAGDHPHWV
jgi:hypothetical protein